MYRAKLNGCKLETIREIARKAPCFKRKGSSSEILRP